MDLAEIGLKSLHVTDVLPLILVLVCCPVSEKWKIKKYKKEVKIENIRPPITTYGRPNQYQYASQLLATATSLRNELMYNCYL